MRFPVQMFILLVAVLVGETLAPVTLHEQEDLVAAVTLWGLTRLGRLAQQTPAVAVEGVPIAVERLYMALAATVVPVLLS